MAEELTIENILKVLKHPRDPQKPWMTAKWIAKRLLGRAPTENEANQVQDRLLQYLETSHPEVRYSSLPSKNTLEVLWGAFPHVKRRVLQSLQKDDLPDDIFDTLDPNKPKCFISHSFKDIEKVREIAKILISKNIYPWLAESDLDQGDFIHDSLIRAIDECKYFVGFITRNSLESAWTRKEILTTLRNKRVSIDSMEMIIDGDDEELVDNFKSWKPVSPFRDFNPQYNNLLNEFLTTRRKIYYYSTSDSKNTITKSLELRPIENYEI